MRGRIKRFIEDKGYGFITGEDGQDYFFHISQVRDMVEIKNWMIVNFDIVDGKKGKNAVNISVSEQNNTSRFITCGNTNIRLNNIKQYGLGKYPVLYEKVFREITVYDATTWAAVFFHREEKKLEFKDWYCHRAISKDEADYFVNDDGTVWNRLSGSEKDDTCDILARLSCHDKEYYIGCYYVPALISDENTGEIKRCGLSKEKKEIFAVQYRKYLYITTYQNDNFTFKETEVNFDVTEKYNEINNAMQYR